MTGPLQAGLEAILRRFRKPRVRDAVELELFLGSRAAFLAQKCTVEYCRARAGLLWSSLFKEETFLAVLAVAQRRAFRAGLDDIAVVIAAKLRDTALAEDRIGGSQRLFDAIEAMTGQLVERDAPGVAQDGEALASRLARLDLGGGADAAETGRIGGRRIFAAMPLHTNLTTPDESMIINGVRFQLVRIAEDFERYAEPSPVVRDLFLRHPA